jgi:hypothetical protein
MTCVIILAGHRTHSSTLSGVVHRLGFPAAIKESDLMAEKPMNPKGFWEDNEFYKLHMRMVGLDDHGHDKWWNPWPQEPLQDPGLLEEYRAHVGARAAAHANWSVKDPRLCFLFPVLRRVLRELGADYKVLSLHRPIDESASSMIRCGAMRRSTPRATEREALRTASLHEGARRVQEIDLMQNEPSCLLRVDAVKLVDRETSSGTVTEVAKFLGVEPTQAALDFPDESLRHFRSNNLPRISG